MTSNVPEVCIVGQRQQAISEFASWSSQEAATGLQACKRCKSSNSVLEEVLPSVAHSRPRSPPLHQVQWTVGPVSGRCLMCSPAPVHLPAHKHFQGSHPQHASPPCNSKAAAQPQSCKAQQQSARNCSTKFTKQQRHCGLLRLYTPPLCLSLPRSAQRRLASAQTAVVPGPHPLRG